MSRATRSKRALQTEEKPTLEELPAKKKKLSAAAVAKAAKEEQEEKERLEREKQNAKALGKFLRRAEKREEEQSLWYLASEPNIYKHGIESSYLPVWEKSLISALEGDDNEKLAALLHSRSVLVSAEGKVICKRPTATDVREEEDVHFELDCNPLAGSFQPFVISLQRDNIAALELLWKYFNPTPLSKVTGLPAIRKTIIQYSQLATAVAETCPTTPLSAKAFGWIIDHLNFNSAFVEYIPSFAVKALEYGQRDTARRCLRFLLQLNYLELSVDVLSKTTSKRTLKRTASQSAEAGGAISQETFNVTLLHLAALEATNSDQLPQPLNEDTTNAGSLQRFITPVHLAALNPEVEIIKALISAGGDVTINDDNRSRNPIHYAAAAEPAPSSKKEKKKKVKEGEEEEEVEFSEILRPSPTLVYLLHEAPNAQNDLQHYITDTRAILGMAINALRPHNVAYLLHKDRESSTRWYQYNGEVQLLNRVATIGDPLILRLCLAHPKFFNSLYNDKRTIDDVLEHAINNRRSEFFKELLASDVQASLDEILLQTAIKQSAFQIVKCIVEDHKVPLNSNVVSSTPLHLAVQQDFVECAEWLISKGAQIRAKDGKGVFGDAHCCSLWKLSLCKASRSSWSFSSQGCR
eukprot:TRINITY_DN6274_c0_g1_i1.p1 TRINITY_DN6274_c0_g1~~TRINITY_DN6274_c0_g1_i1.p1  ORF type:complete len:650 (+),score=158.25 TRINITY_DN6274_c0_g1_i1:40-1950(+)